MYKKNNYFCAPDLHMKRKLTAYFLLFLMAFNAAGFYLVFEANRFLVKREMSALISSDKNLRIEKIVITANLSSLKYVGKKEIEYRGKMYDVIYRSTRGTSLVFYCVHDSKEEMINTGIAKMMKDQIKHLLIPVFGTIAVFSEKKNPFGESGQKFQFLPFFRSVSPSYRTIPEIPPKTC
ncbi:MAG: hypothetical protein D4R97_03945 [Bacteroidetes bacterium]|nr:MAG: hypothetical protein D4R97_03945 [Bacteroidota bacterium]